MTTETLQAAHAGLLHAAASATVAVLGVAAIRAQGPLLEAGYLRQHRTLMRLVLACVLPVLLANALYLALVGLADEMGSGIAGGHALLVLRCVSGAEVLLSLVITYLTWRTCQRHNTERLLPDLGATARSLDLSARGAINGAAASQVGPLPIGGESGHTLFYPSGKIGGGDRLLDESTFVRSPEYDAALPASAVNMAPGSAADLSGARSLPGPGSLGMVRDVPMRAGAYSRHNRRSAGGGGGAGGGQLGGGLGRVDLPSSLNEAHDMIMHLHRSEARAWAANKALHAELAEALGSGGGAAAAGVAAKMAQLADTLQQHSALTEQVIQLQEQVRSCSAAAEQARAAAAEAASRSQREAARSQKLAMQVEVEQAANLELQRMLEGMGGGATEVSMSDLSDVEGGLSGMEGALVGSYPHRAAAVVLNQHRRGSGKSRTVSGSSVDSY